MPLPPAAQAKPAPAVYSESPWRQPQRAVPQAQAPQNSLESDDDMADAGSEAGPQGDEGEELAQARKVFASARRLHQQVKVLGAPGEVMELLRDRMLEAKEVLDGLRPRTERLANLRASIATRETQLQELGQKEGSLRAALEDVQLRATKAQEAMKVAQAEIQAIEKAQAAAAAKEAAKSFASPQVGGQPGLVQLLAAQAATPLAAARLLEEMDKARSKLLAMVTGEVSGGTEAGVKRARLDGSGVEEESAMTDVNSSGSSYLA